MMKIGIGEKGSLIVYLRLDPFFFFRIIFFFRGKHFMGFFFRAWHWHVLSFNFFFCKNQIGIVLYSKLNFRVL